jgi:hypothetical protein
LIKGKGKGKIWPITGHEGPEGQDGVGGQHHAPNALPPIKTRYPLYRRLVGPQGRSGRVQKISPPPGFFFFFFFFTIFDRLDLFDLLVVRVTNMGQIILLPLPKEGML